MIRITGPPSDQQLPVHQQNNTSGSHGGDVEPDTQTNRISAIYKSRNIVASSGTYSYKNIWKVAYPILISLIMEQMIGLTDTAFLGRVGEVELGASAIAIG